MRTGDGERWRDGCEVVTGKGEVGEARVESQSGLGDVRDVVETEVELLGNK